MPYCNWNVWADPLSAKAMFTKAKHIRVYGLEITNKLTLTQKKVKSLFTSDILKTVLDFGEPWLLEHIMTFHDPLAATALFNPNLCTYKRGYVKIDVNTENEKRYGITTFTPDDFGNCELAISVDINKFFENYF
jgi:purine nucleosidase